MGVSYVWVCDERKEWIDPYPLDCPHLFVWCDADLVKDERGEYTHGWYGLPVRLLSDCGGTNDEYYLRTASRLDRDQEEIRKQAEAFGGGLEDVYRNVTAAAQHLAAEYFPAKWWEREQETPPPVTDEPCACGGSGSITIIETDDTRVSQPCPRHPLAKPDLGGSS